MTRAVIRASVQDNLAFRWTALIRSRLDGLTDDGYVWEPVDASLSVRPAETPFGNIAWRMAHLAAVLSSHPVAAVAFGPAWPDPALAEPAGNAVEAVERLDRAYAHWQTAVAALSDTDLARRLGPAAGQYAESTVLDLILHVQAEALQRGADLCLLRDLYERLAPRQPR